MDRKLRRLNKKFKKLTGVHPRVAGALNFDRLIKHDVQWRLNSDRRRTIEIRVKEGVSHDQAYNETTCIVKDCTQASYNGRKDMVVCPAHLIAIYQDWMKAEKAIKLQKKWKDNPELFTMWKQVNGLGQSSFSV